MLKSQLHSGASSRVGSDPAAPPCPPLAGQQVAVLGRRRPEEEEEEAGSRQLMAVEVRVEEVEEAGEAHHLLHHLL